MSRYPVQDLIQYPSLELKEFVETWHKVGETLSYHSEYDEVRKRLNLAVTTIMGAREGKPYHREEWLSLLSGRGSQLLISGLCHCRQAMDASGSATARPWIASGLRYFC